MTEKKNIIINTKTVIFREATLTVYNTTKMENSRQWPISPTDLEKSIDGHIIKIKSLKDTLLNPKAKIITSLQSSTSTDTSSCETREYLQAKNVYVKYLKSFNVLEATNELNKILTSFDYRESSLYQKDIDKHCPPEIESTKQYR